MPKMTDLTAAERLILQAFEAAKKKGNPNWRSMTLSVLKNRLLQISNRRFNELEYAHNFVAFVALFPHLLRRDAESDVPSVVLIGDVPPLVSTTGAPSPATVVAVT